MLSQNDIFLDDTQTIGVKFLNYHHDLDSSFNISLNTDNNMLISTKQQLQILFLDIVRLPFGLNIASGTQLEITQHSKRELYLNCPIMMAPVHHWPELILINLSENPINLEAGEVLATINLQSPKACVMIATDVSLLQNKILCAEEAALLSEQNKLGACVGNAMAHLATLTADL